ncbi:putative T7SS-secreted protein [Streptomyces werraensis]|uniref:putative T7SS-secreted protein n=1 Tax=Streptomyces werraensis TaxID=68284 RepID=UPI00343108F6
MKRPRADEWAVIGEQADPVPGDPEEVARLGRELRRTAESIRKQADEIRALSRVDQWKSKAAKEFRAEAEEAEGKLRKAMRRYDAAADTLGEKVSDAGCSQEYASQLHRAQTMADKALREARDAVDEHKVSAGALDRLPDDTPDDDPGRRKLEKRQEAAATALVRARDRLEAAKAVRDAAARRARESIRHAIDHDGLKDGAWDKVKDWVHDNAGWMKTTLDVAGWVATVCGTLALLVGWVPSADDFGGPKVTHTELPVGKAVRTRQNLAMSGSSGTAAGFLLETVTYGVLPTGAKAAVMLLASWSVPGLSEEMEEAVDGIAPTLTVGF